MSIHWNQRLTENRSSIESIKFPTISGILRYFSGLMSSRDYKTKWVDFRQRQTQFWVSKQCWVLSQTFLIDHLQVTVHFVYITRTLLSLNLLSLVKFVWKTFNVDDVSDGLEDDSSCTVRDYFEVLKEPAIITPGWSGRMWRAWSVWHKKSKAAPTSTNSTWEKII